MKKVRIISIILTLLVLVILGYYFYSGLVKEHVYEVDVGSAVDDSGVIHFERGFGERLNEDHRTFRWTNDWRFDFILEPDRYLGQNRSAEFSMDFDADADIDIWNDNKWQPFYRSKWKNYTQVANVNGLTVFADCNLINCSNVTDKDTILKWIYANFPLYSSIYFLNNEYEQKDFVNNEEALEDGWTSVNVTLRGKHELLVYLGDEFNMSVLKQDLNWYDGEDILQVQLYDSNDNLVYEDEIIDDGIFYKDSSKKFLQNKSFYYPLDTPGVYKLVLNQNEDTSIKSFVINTKKMIFINRVFPLDPLMFYTGYKPRKLTALTYHDEGVQNLTTNNVVVLKIINKSIIYNLTLNDSDYYLTIPKGDVIIQNAWFSIDEDSLFEPYTYTVDSEAPFVITDEKTDITQGIINKKITLANIQNSQKIRFQSDNYIAVDKASLRII